MNYTFNGLGEYVLLSIQTSNVTFSLQARTERAKKADGNISDATIFTAFAARDHTNSSLHIELNTAKDVNADGKQSQQHIVTRLHEVHCKENLRVCVTTWARYQEDASGFCREGYKKNIASGKCEDARVFLVVDFTLFYEDTVYASTQITNALLDLAKGTQIKYDGETVHAMSGG
ncbi:hypothetical protein DPMN_089601 [Dreissena polymorpha]|uniref:Uncharacterized protein n=1 Tax=Dreissena polymorpha TaxID=45954 RepID=A0A9D4KW95_DREPO|nr:hypothetical protein DPMN_089601 [Dreissena polymorpha]